uniref:helix-turn-helix transcriptional regulator n=2 Tax=Flavobacterium sp. TaxID=239 RepID=UPI00404B75EB
MHKFQFKVINQTILTDSTGNEIRFSSVNQIQASVNFKSFSVKHVLKGEELYEINQKKFLLKAGQFVVGNSTAEAKVIIDSPITTKGICIDVSKALLDDIIDFEFENNESFKNFLFEHESVIQKHISEQTQLGKTLENLSHNFECYLMKKQLCHHEIMIQIAEGIVKDQYEFYQGFQTLKFKKETTNKRLFDFIFDAKNFIDVHYLNEPTIEMIAHESKLSSYHFIRLFKKVFKTTPYQYALQKRLELAKELVQNKLPITEVSHLTGFADVASFSKAFKSHFKIAPSYLLHKN